MTPRGDAVCIPRERPILMSAPMVRATLRDAGDGPKTETRRVIRAFKHADPDGHVHDCIKDEDGLPSRLDLALPDWNRCPYGVAGDQLWVRETWCQPDPSRRDVVYRADIPEALLKESRAVTRGIRVGVYAWRPSIFMPRWASRITLEVIRVRVQRLHDLTENDARAEGCAPLPGRRGDGARQAFILIWTNLNAHRPGCRWDDNPWVWAITFRRIHDVPDVPRKP